MEDEKGSVAEQLSLNFEGLVDIAKRVCERYGVGDRGIPASVPLADLNREAS